MSLLVLPTSSRENFWSFSNYKSLIAGLSLFLLLLAGCQYHLSEIHYPAYETTDRSLVLTTGEMSQLIQAGLMVAGWQKVDEKPGEMLAKVTSGGHTAVVKIRFNEVSYLIELASASPGLKYEATGQLIHHRYNFWVDRLHRVIQKEIAGVLIGRIRPSATPVHQSPESTVPETSEVPTSDAPVTDDSLAP